MRELKQYMPFEEFENLLIPTDDGYHTAWFDMNNGRYLLIRTDDEWYEDSPGNDGAFDVFEYRIDSNGLFDKNYCLCFFFPDYYSLRKFMDEVADKRPMLSSGVELKEQALINKPILYPALPDQGHRIFTANLMKKENWEDYRDREIKGWSCLIDMENGRYLKVVSETPPRELNRKNPPVFMVQHMTAEKTGGGDFQLKPCPGDVLGGGFSTTGPGEEGFFIVEGFSALRKVMEETAAANAATVRMPWPEEEKLPVTFMDLLAPGPEVLALMELKESHRPFFSPFASRIQAPRRDPA